jgi:hypothetical protein
MILPPSERRKLRMIWRFKYRGPSKPVETLKSDRFRSDAIPLTNERIPPNKERVLGLHYWTMRVLEKYASGFIAMERRAKWGLSIYDRTHETLFHKAISR